MPEWRRNDQQEKGNQKERGWSLLKDAFFCLPLHEASQKIFAFEWENPKRGCKTQLTWTVLSQGSKNSLTLFGGKLAKDLESWEAPPEEGKLLQYVDNLLIATWTKEMCVAWTVSLLNFLGLQEYRASKKKAQVVKQKVIYLGYEVSAGQRTLGHDCKERICQTPKPKMVKELRTFLGMTGWLLEVKGGHWLSPHRFLKYQAIMVEQDDVEIVVTNIVNPASFLSGNQGEPVYHDCLKIIETTYSSHPDLKDTLFDDAGTWFTHGSSYVIGGKLHAGYTINTSRSVIEFGPLPAGASAQKAEIIALTHALERAEGKKINIYTDSRYAFGVVYAHGAIWKERGLLNSQGKNIKHTVLV
ncbi:hypothetical protein DUI87_02758 [Hirundo rustica rustica]|uniref:ribonuclease H n=1 Tax=Hirundo rustica rustica TaxID=333673 RepID=A0A3M0LS95_HIRRU|nr:hypothetical protein DUI87_02758 [Hirundo rustica rustica]